MTGSGRGAARAIVEAPVWVLCTAAVGVAASAVAGLTTAPPDGTAGPIALTVVVAVAFTPLGVFVLRRLPGHALGRLMTFSGLVATVASLAVCWSRWLPAAWVSQWAWWPPLAAVPLLLLVAPDGHLPSPRWRTLGGLLVGAGLVSTVGLAVAALGQPRTLLSTGEFAVRMRVVLLIALGALALVLVASLAVLASLAVRWTAATPLVRRQLLCLAPSAVLLAAGLAVDAVFSVPVAWLVAVASLPLGLTVAVLRYQLHDLDLYVHRGVAWLVLTALVVAAYSASVTALGAVFSELTAPAASVLAAAVVAAVLQPAQHVVHRGVGRLLYGRRDDPYAVLARLGGDLGTVRDPLAVLPRIASGLVDELKVPYAAVRLRADDGTVTTGGESGRWTPDPERFPMTVRGRTIGELVVAPRRAGTRFTATEARLLRDLAAQTAVAADALRSAVELRVARDRLVLAREEERRTIRRELHDGVAASLVGTRMLGQALRRTVDQSGSAPALLDALTDDIDAAVGEVRALVDGLRPAALDDGLGPALIALTDRSGNHGLRVELTMKGSLAAVPAAVEVAAYRIVAEALANVVKHAEATLCTVAVRRDERELAIHLRDDGRGGDGEAGSGVGLSSIRERATELGGRVEMHLGPAGGRLDVRLPLGA